MFDPITLIAFGGIAAIRWWSGENKKEAAAERSAAASYYNGSMRALKNSTERLLTNCTTLSDRRLGNTRTLVDRIIYVAHRLDNRRQIFNPDSGWFAGKGYGDIRRMVIKANKVFVPPSQVASEAELVLWAVAGIQVVEALDKWHVVSIPFLNENLHDVVAHLPIDGAGHAADWLGHAGAGAMHVADALGIVGIVFSGWRIASNIGSAADLRGDASAMRARANKANSDRRMFDEISDRASYIDTGLADASYDAFKWAWIANKVLLSPQPDPNSTLYKTTLRQFERAARQFWAFLDIPLLDEHGRAQTLPMPVYQTL